MSYYTNGPYCACEDDSKYDEVMEQFYDELQDSGVNLMHEDIDLEKMFKRWLSDKADACADDQLEYEDYLSVC